MGKLFGLAAAATLCLVLSSTGSAAADEERPAFVIVERTATTRPRLPSKSTPSWHAIFFLSMPPATWREAKRTHCSKGMGLHPVAWQYCNFPIWMR